jgi:hypothetical protein
MLFRFFLTSRTPRKQEFSNGKQRESMMKEEFEDSSMDVPEIDAVSVTKVTKPTKRIAKKRKLSLNVENIKEEPKPQHMKFFHDFIQEYGPQLKYSYDLWKKNSKVLERASIENDSTENPLEWSIYKVCKFVNKTTNDESISKKFHEQDIDGSAFLCLNQDDLVNTMKIKIGPAIKIYNRILHVREEVTTKFIKH